MIILDSVKYLSSINSISIVLRDTVNSGTPIQDRISNIKLIKGTSNVETYTLDYSENIESSDNNLICITANVATSISKDDSSYSDLSLNGVTGVSIIIDSRELIGYIYDEGEFYTYKMEMFSSENNDKNRSNITRFLFLELAMINALSLGYIIDAENIYNEMARIYNSFKYIYK